MTDKHLWRALGEVLPKLSERDRAALISMISPSEMREVGLEISGSVGNTAGRDQGTRVWSWSRPKEE